ncbi:MAG: hypothetical protein F8N37_08820 [Telmatospirillum sp.]|nr:hypothetical protein [Telmatospirillum sp.]
MAYDIVISIDAEPGQRDGSAEGIADRLSILAGGGSADLGLTWSEPRKVSGLSEHFWELLGSFGALALPASIAASVLANEITRIFHGLRHGGGADTGRITLTLADLDRGRTLTVDFPPGERIVAEAVAERVRTFFE